MYPLELCKEDLEKVLKQTGCHPASIDIFREKVKILPIFISEIKASVANILKQEMISAKGDAAVHAGTAACRVEKTPVLLLGTISQYRDLIPKLKRQGLPSLDAVAQDLRLLLDRMGNTITRQITSRGKVLDYSHPNIMGILNVTEDSFYDGGKYPDLESVIEAARRMVEHGASIIDIGGESTRPGAIAIDAEEEVRRVVPVIQAIASELDVVISVDTYKASVAEAAVSAGAEMVNDISGLTFDPDMADLVASTGVLLVMMHIQGTPRNMQKNPHYQDVIADIVAYFERQLEVAVQAGIEREKIILDPGIGFGKTLAHNLDILAELKAFEGFGLPILIGASRKSMIGAILDNPVEDRLFGTLGVHAAAYINGASVLRVHDVKEHVEMLRVMDRIFNRVKD